MITPYYTSKFKQKYTYTITFFRNNNWKTTLNKMLSDECSMHNQQRNIDDIYETYLTT